MSVAYSKVGKWGLSKTYEDTFAEYEDTASDYECFNYEGGIIRVQPNTYFENSNEVNLTHGAVVASIINNKLEGSRSCRLTTNLAAMAFTGICQTVTVTNPESGAYKSVCELESTAALTIKTRNMLEKYGALISQHAGVFIRSIEITGERGGHVMANVDLIGTGKYKASSITAANMKTYSAVQEANNRNFKYGDVDFIKGTFNLSTNVFSTVTNYSSDLISFAAKIGLQTEQDYQFSDSTGNVTDIIPIKPEISLTAVVKTSDQTTWRDLRDNQTEFAISIPIIGYNFTGTAYYTVTLDFPKVRVKVADPQDDNGKIVTNLEFQPIMTENDTCFVATIINETTTYVGAAS